jgi:hypothetical protein
VNKGLSGHLYRAVVHAPFRPVGYVLIDGRLLLPATWHDPEQRAPGVGDLVAVEELPWPPPSSALPLVAYPVPPEPESALELAPSSEERPMQEESQEALEES